MQSELVDVAIDRLEMLLGLVAVFAHGAAVAGKPYCFPTCAFILFAEQRLADRSPVGHLDVLPRPATITSMLTTPTIVVKHLVRGIGRGRRHEGYRALAGIAEFRSKIDVKDWVSARSLCVLSAWPAPRRAAKESDDRDASADYKLKCWETHLALTEFEQSTSAVHEAVAIIHRSGLFDTEWYIKEYMSEASKLLDPLIHYVTIGCKIGCQPNRLFDPIWYLMQNPDVARAGNEPLTHYITIGAAKGRRPGPRFDPAFYRRRIGEAALGGQESLAHYLASRVSEDSGLDEYADWIVRYDRITDADRSAIASLIATMADRPLISVIMPVYETPEKYLRMAIESVIDQLYPCWELCIVDDCSPSAYVRRVLDEYKSHPQVKVRHRSRNGHISAASNDGLEMAQGQFVALLDHDDELTEHALFMVASAINDEPNVDLIYSDEDRIDGRNQRFNPYFKGDWSPELILAQNFFCHLGVYRRSLLLEIGGFRSEFDGSQDYDLVLRAQRATQASRILHIPHILYHWRSIPGSTASNSDEAKPYARDAASHAIADHLASVGVAATVVKSAHPAFNRVKFDLPSKQPLVSIILHGGSEADARRTISSVLASVTYKQFEILRVSPRESLISPRPVFAFVRDKKVRSVRTQRPVSGPEACNRAATAAKGDILCFLECGVEVVDSEWLDELVAQILQPGVGVVGSMICTSAGHVRNAGYLLEPDQIALAAYPGLRLGKFGEFGYFGKAVLVQNLSAVSGIGLAVSKHVFSELGGFNAKQLSAAFADVDFCQRAVKSGYRVVWTPHARLADDRMSSVDAQSQAHSAAATYMRHSWAPSLEKDPFLGPNLVAQDGDLKLAWPPSVLYMWREPALKKINHAASETSHPDTAVAPRSLARPNRFQLPFGKIFERNQPIVDQRSRRLILGSGLFDADWYLRANADVAGAGIDALDHYLLHGSPEGRSPNPGFDPAYYRKNNLDVDAAGIEPLVHYILHGSAEGRRPNQYFDPGAYRREHPELAAGGIDPLLHYLTWALPYGASSPGGRALIEGSGLFNAKWYVSNNPEVGEQGDDPLDHYLSIGWKEGRSPNPGFDPAWYVREYQDVAASETEPLTHYISIGSAEGRRPNSFFDPALYRAQHPAISKTGLDPLAHELLSNSSWASSETQTRPVRTPALKADGQLDAYRLISASGLFNTSWYLSQNPDVSAAGVDALEHYIGNGSSEGRAPNPGFDPDWYREAYQEVTEAGLEPLLHYILHGTTKGFRPNKNFDPGEYTARYPEISEIGIGALAHHLLTRSGAESRKSSSNGDPLRLTDLPDFELPDMFEMRALKPTGPIAVVVHVYHNDLWREMADAISNIPKPFDVFVSLVAGVSAGLESEIKRDFPQAHVFVFPHDRGRDIARFVAFLQTGALFRYDLVCKIHSKRSSYVDDGDLWRRQLIEGILGSKKKVKRILSAFTNDPDLGIVVADGNIYSGDNRWSGNEVFLDRLLPRLSISTDYKNRSFPGGGMFWIRPLILRSLLGTGISLHDFELEPMPVNGALGHAAERLYGLICEDAGMIVREWSDIEREANKPAVKMPSKLHVFAFLLPQFHPIPENNTWWGEGFTEWTNVTRAKPMYAEHRQPKLPADLGFYDLRTPETRVRQADLAKQYGVDGFCYYFYWFNGRRILERPLNDLLKSGTPDLPFMICWANEPWSRNWDGLNEETLLPQTYEPGWEKDLARDVAPALKDPRYFRLDGRPMFLVYRARHIQNCKRAMNSFRAALESLGITKPHLCAALVDFPNDENLPADPAELGFDSYYEFPPHRAPARLLTPRPPDVADDSGIIFDYGKTVDTAIERLDAPHVGRRHRGVMVGFDNTSRRAKRAIVFHGSTPTNFRRWLRATIISERKKEGERVVFINAWNEWAEGAVLEPDRDFGRGWLEAVASATSD